MRNCLTTPVLIATIGGVNMSYRLSSRLAGRVQIGLVLLFSGFLCVCAASVAASTLAQFRTPLGDIDVELFDQDKPITVRNFVSYVDSGRYSRAFVHRWVPGFVIQGGGFRVATRGGTNILEAVPTLDSITNEFRVGRTFSNRYGTLAMARVGGLTNSATSQWFFNLADNAQLDSVDGGFTVFGRVLRGTNVLNRFNNIAATNRIFRAQLQAPLDNLPVLANPATLADLVFSEVTLLTVHARVERGERVLSWTSISNRPNHLQAGSAADGIWQNIFSATGSGEPLEFIDRSSETRYYRVRVDY